MTNNLPAELKDYWVQNEIIMPADVNSWAEGINQLSDAIPLYAHTGNFYTATYSNNVYNLTPLSFQDSTSNVSLSSYTEGMTVSFICPAANSASCQVKIGSLDTVPIRDIQNNIIREGFFRIGYLITLVYSSANQYFKVYNQAVQKTGDTMTGTLTIKYPDIDLSTTPSINYYRGIDQQDKNANRLGIVEVFHKTDGSYGVNLGAKQYGQSDYNTLQVSYDSNGTPHTSVITPPSNSNDRSIPTTAWVRNYVNSKSGYEINDIIWRLLPTEDAKKHLLDGDVLSGSGAYAEYVSYMAGLASQATIQNIPLYCFRFLDAGGRVPIYVFTETDSITTGNTYPVFDYHHNSLGTATGQDSNSIRIKDKSAGWVPYTRDTSLDLTYVYSPDGFTTESDWQTQVSAYGSCGKFVYDSTANTLRLPKISDILQGTTDLTAFGDLVEASIPNITAQFALGSGSSTRGAVYMNGTTTGESGGSGGVDEEGFFDARLASSVYKDDATTVQPQVIKGLLYIVLANTEKTEVMVDIDNVMTDLNNKAAINLTNVTNSNTKCIDGQWVNTSVQLANNVSLPVGTDQEITYNLSSALPNDNYKYEVVFSYGVQTGNSSGAGLSANIIGSGDSIWHRICDTYARGSWYMNAGGNVVVTVGTARTVRFKYTAISKAGQLNYLYVEGYKRKGTNS